MAERNITLRRARTNNLADVDVDVPRNRLAIFVGVSGSGKSSLVFDTIAAEAGYQLNETFPLFARNRLPKWSRPDVEHIEGLTPVVVIDQRRIGRQCPLDRRHGHGRLNLPAAVVLPTQSASRG
ncbi:MAG: hypothetical protein ACRDPW_10955 [Mycobacteriales bacterium]